MTSSMLITPTLRISSIATGARVGLGHCKLNSSSTSAAPSARWRAEHRLISGMTTSKASPLAQRSGRPDAAFKDSVSRTLNENGTREIRFGRVENDPDDVCCQIEEALGGKGLADEQRLGVDVSMAYEEAKSVALDARRRTARRMSPAEVERLIDEWLVAGNEVKTKENDPRLRPYRLKSGRLAPGAPHPPGEKLRINARGLKQAAGRDGKKSFPTPRAVINGAATTTRGAAGWSGGGLVRCWTVTTSAGLSSM